ncbi:hypothetical protein [Defluviitalea saccharophila]|uniref:YitT family protein n=1 Tax=Defluviitalea saccharophila TaxID=879970 RepID=A0ABZ2Y1Y2_9FIRM|nr:hypothetical protein [Candidatus Epulonipiscium sp.]
MKQNSSMKMIYGLIGIFLVGIGVAFNASTMFGNDPIGIVYDGVRNVFNLSTRQLGMASNVVNIGLIILLLFTGRKYVNVGTFIYIIPYGFFVSIGTKLYTVLVGSNTVVLRSLAGIIGCLALYTGVAIFIVMDIGLDPFTGLVMTIKDKISWDYKKTKIFFDVFMVIIGVLLGGKWGVITLVTAFTAGPMIQLISERLRILLLNR